MELKYKAIACFLIGIFSLSGCTSTFDDLNTNPDTTTKVNASMLASKVILDMTKSASNWRNEFLVKRMFWGEQIDDRQYNRFGKGSFDNIQTLTNAWKMVELSSEDDLDAHTGLYYFLKGWYFYRTTMDMGDIPYSEALNIEEHRYPQTLPIGEFAIGTNTTAYVMAEQYGIAGKLPILIAEKMGPHFAMGDTCYAWAEDSPMYNPDGKEVIARENEVSAKRKEDPSKAYFGCHTDITIPYRELQSVAVEKADGTTIPLIEDGRFVLPGTEELNEPFG